MHSYALLNRVAELYESVRLDNVLLLACQHLLEPQKQMFMRFLDLGLKPENCVIVGKNYSTNVDVTDELRALGCVVAPFSTDFEPLESFDSWFQNKLTSFISEEIARRPMNSYDKVIILDDGGFMHLVADKLCTDVSNVIGVEQTSSGHYRIQAANIRFESISVARSHHKLHFESPYIGKIGAERILKQLWKCGRMRPNIMITGLGFIGRQMAGHLLVVNRFAGAVTDLKLTESREILCRNAIADLMSPEQILMPAEARQRISEFDVIIGATGSPIMSSSDINSLHHEALLISMSSSDREFPAVHFRQTRGKVHDDYVRGGRILANGGFPITFGGERDATAPEEIEFTMALLATRILHAVSPETHMLALVTEQIRELWQPEATSAAWYEAFRQRPF